jgi:hypothetical protein
MAVRVKGQVARIYASSGHTYIRLSGLPANDTPKDGYFQLLQTHPNYDALYSLALTAAVNHYDLDIRATEEIDPSEYAVVSYMVVDWLTT